MTETDLPAFALGPVSFPLWPSLTTTINAIAERPDEDLRQASRRLGAITSSRGKQEVLLQAFAQVKWHEEYSGTVPPRVLATYEERRQEACSVAKMTPPEPAPSVPDEPPPPRAKPRPPRGVRPFCRELILAGELDENKLLEQTLAKFPDQVGIFKMADVRWQLRLNGKLAWTSRRGRPNASTIKLDKTPS